MFKSNKKILVLSLALLLSLTMIVGCGSSGTATPPAANPNPGGTSTPAPTPAPAPAGDNTAAPAPAPAEPQYLTAADLNADIVNNTNAYTILDVRQTKDYDKERLPNSYSTSMHLAKDGDAADGIANIEASLAAAGIAADDKDAKFVYICYQGKTYANTARDLMLEMGFDNDQLFILENGINNWPKDFKDTLVK